MDASDIGRRIAVGLISEDVTFLQLLLRKVHITGRTFDV